MSKKEKAILLTLGGVITTLTVFVTLRLWTSDPATSIIPGWHTTVYPSEITWTIVTIAFLLTILLVYLTIKGGIKLLILLWVKLKS